MLSTIGSPWYGDVLSDVMFSGEGVANGSVSVIKVHEPFLIPVGDKVVLLLRDPLQAMWADYQRKQSPIRKNRHSNIMFSTLGSLPSTVKKDLSGMAATWFTFCNSISERLVNPEGAKNMLVVYYDQMVSEPKRELRRIVDFLGLEISLDHNHAAHTSPSSSSLSRSEEEEVSLDCAVQLSDSELIRRKPGGLTSDQVFEYLAVDYRTKIEPLLGACAPRLGFTKYTLHV